MVWYGDLLQGCYPEGPCVFITSYNNKVEKYTSFAIVIKVNRDACA